MKHAWLLSDLLQSLQVEQWSVLGSEQRRQRVAHCGEEGTESPGLLELALALPAHRTFTAKHLTEVSIICLVKNRLH